MHLPCDQVILLPYIYPREMKVYVHTKTCMRVFITDLFIIAQTWKQPKYPSTIIPLYHGTLSKRDDDIWDVLEEGIRFE